MSIIAAVILGLAALVSQSHPLPADFVEGALTRSEPVVRDDFVGIEWSPFYEGTPEHALRPSELRAEPWGMQHDALYAGLDLRTMQLVTGP